MPFSGPPAISAAPLADASPTSVDSRRIGFISLSERTTYGSREDPMPRFAAPAAYDQLSPQEHATNFGTRDLRNPDCSFDRPLAASPPAQSQASGLTQNIPPEKGCSEERLRDMSMAAIKEFYRFESVLGTLEDAVNDAPKAAEFLGGIFAKVIVENVISLTEIGCLIHDGGEEPGHLLEKGMAGDVFGSILGIIKREKGGSVLNEIRASSNLRLEDFRSSDPNRSKILENFI